MQATGAGTNAQGQDTSFVSGARRIEGRLAVSANCGSVVGVERDSDVDTTLADDCEKLLLRTVKSLSQSTPDQPYLVPAPSDFDWNEKLVTLASSDTALILEGRYEFADVHTPCRWVSDCCSVGGIYYLDSCREPTASELEIVQTCLSKAKSPRSSEFEGCLRSAGVKTGCEVQPDGSKICY